MEKDFLEKGYGIKEGTTYYFIAKTLYGEEIYLKEKVSNMNARQIMFVDEEKGLYILEWSKIIEMRPIKIKPITPKVEKDKVSYFTELTNQQLENFTIEELKGLSRSNKIKAIIILENDIISDIVLGTELPDLTKDILRITLHTILLHSERTKREVINILYNSITEDLKGEGLKCVF